MKDFDVIVIGTGSAGTSAAYTAKGTGKSVAIVEASQFGGTCANKGCDPKKVLIAATEAVDWFQRMKTKDTVKGFISVDWQELMKFKRTFTDPVSTRVKDGLQKAGIETFEGIASFVNEHTVVVNDKKLTGKYIVIATGATPMELGVAGEEHIAISDDFLELDTLPKEIIFVGGGFISFEFAHLATRSGAKATIIHRSDRVLKGFDPDLVKTLIKESEKLGITIELNTPLDAIKEAGDRYEVHAGEKKFHADLVVHGAGRIPAIKDLNLENAGVETSRRGVVVNKHMQTSQPHTYAGGDVAALGLALTPVAGRQGEIIGNNIVYGNKLTFDNSVIPSAVFTIPPLASVGLLESQATEKGLEFEVKTGDSSPWFASKRINETSGYKILIEKKTNKILGAHLMGHHVEEAINIFALAMKNNLTVEALREVIYSYPTHASNIPYML